MTWDLSAPSAISAVGSIAFLQLRQGAASKPFARIEIAFLSSAAALARLASFEAGLKNNQALTRDRVPDQDYAVGKASTPPLHDPHDAFARLAHLDSARPVADAALGAGSISR